MATFSPLRYPGGKDKTYKYVRYLIKDHNISSYIEPFAGGAAVALRLLINNDVDSIIINDYDISIYSLWHVILTQPENLIQLIQNVEINMDEWYKQKSIQGNKYSEDELLLAFSTLFLNRTNRSGIIKAGVIGGKQQNGKYLMDCRFNKSNLIDKIRLIASHRDQISVYNMDAKNFIDEIIPKNQNSLTFFDPPYYKKGPDLYTDFYSHYDHKDLSYAIKNQMIDNYWILTYDIAEEIEELYSDLRKQKYNLNYSIAKPSKGQEFMFFSRKINPGNINEYLKTI